ncbi:MAG: hypothetical protein IJZ00_07655 [Lachnospiraceae bacterium]|nr:hypothetical protein [Lachnospiraceae bacterium]
MWQAQKKVLERENRRKDDYPVVIVLGDAVKNCITVIFSKMGRYQNDEMIAGCLCRLFMWQGKLKQKECYIWCTPRDEP